MLDPANTPRLPFFVSYLRSSPRGSPASRLTSASPSVGCHRMPQNNRKLYIFNAVQAQQEEDLKQLEEHSEQNFKVLWEKRAAEVKQKHDVALAADRKVLEKEVRPPEPCIPPLPVHRSSYLPISIRADGRQCLSLCLCTRFPLPPTTCTCTLPLFRCWDPHTHMYHGHHGLTPLRWLSVVDERDGRTE